MNKTIASISAIAFALSAVAVSHGSIIVNYDFTDTTGDSIAITDLGAASTMEKSWGVNFGGSISNGSYYDRSNNSIPDTLADSITLPRYVSFTFTPNGAIDLTDISFTIGITNSLGSSGYDVGASVFSSLTGFDDVSDALGGGIHTSAASSGTTWASALDIDLSANSSLQNISDPIEFRIYYHDIAGISNSNAIFRIDDVTVQATAVPEPATMALAFGFAALFVAFRKNIFRVS